MKKIFVWVMVLSCLAGARPLVGTVVRVIDGDTVKVRLPDGEQSVRLDTIDAPERRQAYGKASRKSLAGYLPVGSTVTIVSPGHDRYGRVLGQIYRADGSDVNVLQVESGQAWVYTKYCHDPGFWKPIEERARRAKRGLWAEPHPVPPWEYRHR